MQTSNSSVRDIVGETFASKDVSDYNFEDGLAMAECPKSGVTKEASAASHEGFLPLEEEFTTSSFGPVDGRFETWIRGVESAGGKETIAPEGEIEAELKEEAVEPAAKHCGNVVLPPAA
ncbi:hypothetical protein DOTSEDRAFT_28496 [Dothistroma septosporum NZE10]|uniref:Uncharacterized protein n=1 Tax=Dothistroma septosporum (strain NZE10 / CBS 128990) TaxID=675120 RepID=M2YKE7_DOTSN|nr:hypothetical protein DOTSEDRAFT_28496 [Dothistroma septosporum NZE10]